MSEPNNVFQQKGQHKKTGSLSLLTTQVTHWKRLTKLIQPLLPQPEQWQVACYQHGVLIITGENQAMISQLSYLQKHYITQLVQLEGLQDLRKLQVRLRNKVTVSAEPVSTTKALSSETRAQLRSAAEFVNDPKLSEALVRLASIKK